MTTDNNNEPKLTLDEVKEVLKSAPAPRVTEESIKAKVAKVDYLIHDQMTICFITMQNGWMSTGISKPASAANYDEEVGKRYAYDNAFRTLWQLEGYLLVESLSAKATKPAKDVTIEPKKDSPNAWVVEAIDNDGGIEQAAFAGPDAEKRARSYANSEYQIG